MAGTKPTLEERGRMQGHLALCVVQVCFALFPVYGKVAFAPGGFSPLAVGAWRMLFGAGVLAALALAVHGRAAIPAARDLGRLLACSLLGVTFNMVLYLDGLSRSTPTNASLLMGLIPVFTFAIAALARQEEFRAGGALGVLVALFGASMRFWAEKPDLARENALGNLLMALNALCYAAYFVVSRPLLRRYPPLVVIAWVFLLSVPAVPIYARGEALIPGAVSERAWWALAFILVFPTVVAYLLNIFALSRLRASTTAVYVYVQPLITATASWIVLGERVTRGMILSAGFVFAGIWLVARRPAAPPAAERRV
jgi:drug/metabolite transporter (DMT)-like permease